MSVLIKGMKMPKSCSCCDLRYIAIGYDYQCPKTGETVDGYDDNRHHSCPLVEVPTPHRDLVDRDDLIDEINRVTFVKRYDYNVAYNIVTDAETIIEAEASEL